MTCVWRYFKEMLSDISGESFRRIHLHSSSTYADFRISYCYNYKFKHNLLIFSEVSSTTQLWMRPQATPHGCDHVRSGCQWSVLMERLWCPFLSSCPFIACWFAISKISLSPSCLRVMSMAQQSHRPMKVCQAENGIKEFLKTGVPSYTVWAGWWNKWGDVPPHTIYTAPNHISGCLGCFSSVNGEQQQSAYRDVCLKGRDHPSVIHHPYRWCWAASSLLLQLGTWSTAARQRPAYENEAAQGCYTWIIQAGCGKKPCLVLSLLSPVLSVAMAFHASTVLWLSEEEPRDCADL